MQKLYNNQQSATKSNKQQSETIPNKRLNSTHEKEILDYSSDDDIENGDGVTEGNVSKRVRQRSKRPSKSSNVDKIVHILVESEKKRDVERLQRKKESWKMLKKKRQQKRDDIPREWMPSIH